MDPARREFDRTLQEVGNRYGDVWGSTGAMPEMVARATADYGEGMNGILANMVFNTQQSAADRQANAINPALGVEQQRGQNVAAMYGLGQANRGIESQRNEAEYNKWLSGQWYNNPALGFIEPVLGTQTNGLGQKTGWIPGVMDSVSGLFDIGGGIASMFVGG